MNNVKLKPGSYLVIKNRDTNGIITNYEFHIRSARGHRISGNISREEMELIYKSYSQNGANMTRLQVSKEFSRFSSKDIQHIFRVFNITKNISVLPPHLVEELSVDKAAEYAFSIKEDILVKKIEKEKYYQNEKYLTSILKENAELKEKLEDTSTFLNGLRLDKIKPFKVEKIPYKSDNDVIIYLSDIHIGAEVNNEGVYDNDYHEWEVYRRLSKVYSKIKNIGPIDKLLIMNLGDALDGYNNSTTRCSHNHILPQNMTNREQIKAYITIMYSFFKQLQTLPVNDIQFVSVCESNHGGDFEYAANIALQSILTHMNINCYIANKPIEYIKFSGWNVIYLHGKDNQNMFKNFPLTVNDKVESYFNEYIVRNKLKGKTIVVKGDLHQSATTKAKLFDYKSVGSLFGSSNWIHANFGHTPWACDYSIITKSGERLDGIICE